MHLPMNEGTQLAPATDSGELSSSLEDYLETIFELVRDRKVARVRDIANARGVRSASVTPAMRRLASMGLIEYQEREFIGLTPRGEIAARRVYARHNVLAEFFSSVLGMENQDAQRDACAMEHSLSDAGMDHFVRFLEYLKVCPESAVFLNHYRRCRHVNGDGVCPTSCGGERRDMGLVRQNLVALPDLKIGQRAQVMLVEGAGAVRQRLLDMGMLPGTVVELLRIAPAGGPLWIRMGGAQLSLRRGEARPVLVQPIKGQ